MNNTNFRARWVAPFLALAVVLLAPVQAYAQIVIGPFDYRDYDLEDLGIANPLGIAYSAQANVLYVAQTNDEGKVRVVVVTPSESFLDLFDLDLTLSSPINMAYDEGTGQLLIYDGAAQELVAFATEGDGLLSDTTAASRLSASGYGLSQARGMALDAATQRLYLLDGATQEVVQVAADSNGSYAASDSSRVSRQSLGVPTGARLWGLAYHATSGHFYTLDTQAQELYELDASGAVVERYATADMGLQQVQGLVVAPTADGSDDPALLDLYLVDSQLVPDVPNVPYVPSESLANKTFLPLLRGGDVVSRASLVAEGRGRLLEVYLTRIGQEDVSVAADTAIARLVRTTDTSADFNPPSTDSSGLAYVPSRNRLLMSDSEINEISDLYQGVNVWEITLDAVIQATYTTDPGVSNEPTGLAYAESRGPSGNPHLFVSDDTGPREVLVVDLGADGEFRTADDVVTSINFGDMNLSWTADPEGVAYDSWNDQVVVIDGINQEVYVIHPGSDQLFGTADDTMVHFDVGSAPLGLNDPEGIEFDSDNGHLYILGRNKIAETLMDGTLVRFIDIGAIPSGNIAGIAKAPPSTFDATHPNDIYLYISDRGVDEGFDGRLYEIGVEPLASSQNAPVVNAGPDQNLSGTLVATLNGSVTDDGLPDPPGKVTTQWILQSGPGTAAFDDVNALNTNVTFSTSGVYVLRLFASDGELSGSDEVTILVDVTHTPPVVNAGPDKTVAINAAVQLNGSASDDGLPNPPGKLTTTWSMQTGPGTVTFANANEPTTTATFSEVGLYVLRLTANDGQLSAFDDMTVTVTLPPGYQAIERQISANSDDAEERGGTQNGTTITYGDLEMVFDNGANQTVGLRFNNITIPKGMTIARAYIQFSLDEPESGPTSLTIQGQKSPNAATFSSSGNPNFNITNRPRTLTSVAWNPPAWAGPVGTANGAQRTPDLTAVVQEIINQPGWVSGNSLAFIISGTGERVAVGHDDNPEQAAKLYIVFNPTLPGNQAPVVDAGVAQTVTLPAGVTLNGIVTDDGLPNPPHVVTPTWQMASGPGTVTFANANAVNTTATFSAAGTYVLRLIAEDGQLIGSDVVTITVHPENQPPVVDAGIAQTVTLPAPVNLNGTVTDDGWPQPPGIVTTTWEMVSGPGMVTFTNANALTTTAGFSAAGTYVLRLTAHDGALTASDIVTVTVNPATPDNQAPVVDAGVAQTVTLPAGVTLNGIVTDDGLPNPPSVVTTTWQMVSGPGTVTFANANAVNTTANFSAAGTYVLRLTAEDGELVVSDVVTITVHPENQPPVVNAGADQTIALPAAATLQGKVTDDGWPQPPGKLQTLWTVVLGPGTVTFDQADALETTASFSTDGVYILRLTANDGKASAFDLVTITVHPENQAPTVDAGADQTIVLPADAHLNATVNDDGWPKPPGSISASWSKVSGPGQVTFTADKAVDTTASFSAAGTYVLRLTVTDGEATVTDDVTITVHPTGEEPVVDAGPDQTIMLPAEAVLDGTVVDDGWPQPPGKVTVSWHKQSGPGDVTFGNANEAQTTASFSAPGTYVLRLEAYDGEFTSSDLVTVVVHPANLAPTVDTGGSQTIVVTDTIVLQATIDDDGLPNSTLTVSWSVISGPGTVTFGDPNAATTTVNFSKSGEYVLRLTVSDGDQETHDDITVTVLEPAEPPQQRLFLPGLFSPSTDK